MVSVLDRLLCFIIIHNGKRDWSRGNCLLRGEAILFMTMQQHAICGVMAQWADIFQILIKDPDMVVKVYYLAAARNCSWGL
jgi:hypothetical protein